MTTEPERVGEKRVVDRAEGMDKRLDLSMAIVVTAFGIFLMIAASLLSPGSIAGPIGTGDVAFITGALTVLLGLSLVIRRLLRWRADPQLLPTEGSADVPGYSASLSRVGLVWLACVIYTVVLPWVGFLLVTPLLVGALLWLLDVRRWRHLLLLSSISTAALYVFFGLILQVRLPHGLLEGVL
ncbi:MAG: tripartite tricarboxylate transporter TctB family protein [Microcella sp.]|uniref:tripartite tricarboxylate transporter TctB family protein n=1 Tax=Microcella sp. TaxID=1913979 RepID=UPI0033146BF4